MIIELASTKTPEKANRTGNQINLAGIKPDSWVNSENRHETKSKKAKSSCETEMFHSHCKFQNSGKIRRIRNIAKDKLHQTKL